MSYLLTKNSKTKKSDSLFPDYESYVLQLMPHTNNSLGYNLCPMANGCQDTCLVYTGYGSFKNTQKARENRTELFVRNKQEFVQRLIGEIFGFAATTQYQNRKLVIRLNGFSDIQWENIKVNGSNIFETFQNHKHVIFMDYTKLIKRMYLNIPNYHMTFSGDLTNWSVCEDLLIDGKTVAIVFEKVPEIHKSWFVQSGDTHDLRFLDKPYMITGLKYKKLRGKDNKELLTKTKLVHVV